MMSAFRDRLQAEGRSPAMVRGIMGSLGAILGAAQERGQTAHNPVRELRRGRRSKGHDRQKVKLQVGIDIPKPEEVAALLARAEGRWRPLLLTAVLTGLRASELRGLRWDDVDLKRCELHVRQRADRYGIMGRPKSAAGQRTVPLTPTVVKELGEWKFVCPKRKDGKLGLVFPNGAGNVETGGNIVKRGLIPTVLKAGLVRPVLDGQGNRGRDGQGKPIVEPKYTGLHTLRHFFASWCINRKEQGGLGLPAKVVQERLGHSAIAITLDRYGHLFPRGDDTAELANAEKFLLQSG
jgi:integrase